MSKFEDIKSRWRYVRELVDLPLKIKRYIETIKDEDVVKDVEYLIKEVESLKEDLKDARNPFSSRLGSLVDIKDGQTHYMIEGQFRPAHALQKAMYLLREFNEGYIKKITKEVLKRVKEILREASYEKDQKDSFKK